MKPCEASDLSDMTSADLLIEEIRRLEPTSVVARAAVADALRLAYELRYALERAYVADTQRRRGV